MDKKEAIDRVKKYSDLVVEKMKPSKIMLYGSYARGNWDENSDIDVAIIVNNVDGDF